MKKEFKIMMPVMPNYLLLDMPHDRHGETPKIPIEQLSEVEARIFVGEWSEAFMKHYAERKLNGISVITLL